jgi:hypothetical protein
MGRRKGEGMDLPGNRGWFSFNVFCFSRSVNLVTGLLTNLVTGLLTNLVTGH